MSGRQFDRTENAELRAKIDEAKRLLPLPDLMTNHLGLSKHAEKDAHCPFHKDEHPSFSSDVRPFSVGRFRDRRL